MKKRQINYQLDANRTFAQFAANIVYKNTCEHSTSRSIAHIVKTVVQYYLYTYVNIIAFESSQKQP